MCSCFLWDCMPLPSSHTINVKKTGNIIVVGGQWSVQSIIGVGCDQYGRCYSGDDRRMIKVTLCRTELHDVSGQNFLLGYDVGIRSHRMIVYKKRIKEFHAAP